MRRGALVAAVALPLAMLVAASVDAAVVNDVTQLNPITVERVVTPTSVDEIRELVRARNGAISVGGGRFSMGGQIATEGTLFVDMRGMDRILAFSPAEKTIRVQTGITWRKIQEAIDPHGLSVAIMQSYANFTVGGSLSVNVHGRYVGQGPLIGSVHSIAIVLADGELVEASPTHDPDLFYGAIGGYGGLGIIVEATLDLADDQKVARQVQKLPVREYGKFFAEEVRTSSRAVFHNGDLYPPAYDTVMAITWSATDRPVTVPDRLRPAGPANWLDHVVMFGVSDLPFGKEIRARLLDPLRLRDEPVVWRNYEASYDVGELEPVSRTRSTYVLQEYFVPVGRFDDFVPKMASVFRRHRVNVLNVSIRHAKKDPGSLLAWAKEESFAFVVYYKQGVSEADRKEVGAWTRELIDAALSLGGSYYLPYQIHATDEQFRRAYPRAAEFFALKRRVDPAYRFRNKLWDRYFPPPAPSADEATARKLRLIPGYARSEDQTFLTLPEWYIVYSADEYAQFLDQGGRPSAFPFFRSIGQFWSLYRSVVRATWDAYPFNWGYHAMIGVIGFSFSAEYAAKGLYEATLGRLAERLSTDTEEDRFARRVADEYAAFIHVTPWYEFPFARKLDDLWAIAPRAGESTARRWERRLVLSVDLGLKTLWGWLVGTGTRAAYGPERPDVLVWARDTRGAVLHLDPPARALDPPDRNSRLLSLPRYEPFTPAVAELSRRGVEIVEIGGNRTIVMTMIAPREWKNLGDRGRPIHEWGILTRPAEKRVAIAVAVDRLHEVIPSLEAEGLRVDHVYDY